MKSKEFYNSLPWITLAKVVKLTYCNEHYFIKCFTCGKVMHITDKNCHAGHFIKVFDGNSTNFAVAFDMPNIGINCYQCNHFFGGRPDVMEKQLIKIWGQKDIDMLYIKKRNPCKLDKFTLSLFHDFYKRKFDELVKIKGSPWKIKSAKK